MMQSKNDSNSLLYQAKIYLACPYSHEDEAVRKDRFDKVNKKAGELMIAGYTVFSPISHSHPISTLMPKGNATDFAFWMAQDILYIRDWADEVWVFCLEGWRESRGVRYEIDYALERNIPIRLLKGYD